MVESAFAQKEKEKRTSETHTLDLASATKIAITIITNKAYNPA